MIKSLSFCLPGNALISPSFLKDSFTEYRILGSFFFFHHSASMVSEENSAVKPYLGFLC